MTGGPRPIGIARLAVVLERQEAIAFGRRPIGAEQRRVERRRPEDARAPQDPAALAEAARAIAAMAQADRDRLGRNAHAYFQAHFTQSRIVEIILERLHALVSPAPLSSSG